MEELVSLGKILSDLNRVKILALLHRDKELCVCEICNTLELSQPLVSRHLKQMRKAELVITSQAGKWVIYALKEDERVLSLLSFIQAEIAALPKILKCTR